MTIKQDCYQEISLLISRSNITTEGNKTGSWRFVRPGYDEKTAPCSATCPAGEDIARIEMLAAQGMFRQAWETILQENPFPAVCGRVCFHTCESVCNRAEFDQPVAIHSLERFLGDTAISENFQIPNFESQVSKKIAVAGSGPAGLSAAFFLSKLGYKCDIFEAKTEPGGVLRWGIPRYRLPGGVLKHEIDRIVKQGVQIFCDKPVTQNFLEQAREEYDAVFIGCGYGRSIQLNVPGQDMANDGLEFLSNAGKEEKLQGFQNLEGLAAVIGGGNTAIDVSRSLVRMGATSILVYRRRKQDMPAFGHEIEMALKEGVELRELFAPIQIEKKNGNYVLVLQKMKPAEDSDADGRTRMIPDGDKTEILEVQHIFTAIGADPGENWHVPPKNHDSILNLSHCAFMQNDLPIIFGGDLTNPVKSVADAIASGKQAAMALDTFFQHGWDAIKEKLSSCCVGNGHSLSMEMYMGSRKKRNTHTVQFNEINTDYFQVSDRTEPLSLSPDVSAQSFSETEQTYTLDSVVEESKRCFNCGICNDCDNCRLYCPELAVFPESTARYINLDYCKGCGICVVECPRNAMSLESE